ncbi:hypothetical protein G5B31_00430 [Rhodobacter sp. SGA-6-6]|uniref:hypothetical protein n=1 Tax=Rhodobacter sp. SGA-6-6 TaxID=2710882 RepID=UPI0013EABCA0|nr:hypothetical protein [Rhodobacter sp. SGA-6-6]NGM43993.1 hypothetical protein [Rhodobacter sp. SGA-6-6]
MRKAEWMALSGALAFALVPVSGVPALAGKDAVDVGPVFVPPLAEAEPSAVAQAVEEINLARDFCSRLKRKEYVIDCLAAEMDSAADALPSTPEYAPAKAALKDGSRKLAKIVTDNRSSSLPAGVARDSGHATPRPIRAVETSRMEVATDAAIGVIEETGTILLRSSETSAEAAGFVAISTAVRSNTILLRSI